jgi:hypothetical protein
MLSGVLGVLMVGFLLVHQFSAAQVARQSPTFRASEIVSEALELGGATPDRVMSASWSFYDTRSPWRSRYLHIPIYVNSADALVAEMRRQGAQYLVFDRRVGADQWPALTELMESEHPHRGLRVLGSPLTIPGAPPNTVVIYSLE